MQTGFPAEIDGGHGLLHDWTPEELSSRVGHSGELHLVQFWRRWCFFAALDWPGMRKIAHLYDQRVVCSRVRLRDTEPPGSGLGVRWLPGLVLFVAGQPIRCWHNASQRWERVTRSLDHHTGHRGTGCP